jgi:asparagine synthase (glutamine-hydrolysing)
MVGIGGMVGERTETAQYFQDWLTTNKKELSNHWVNSSISILSSVHQNQAVEYPIECSDGLLWFWGEAYSHKAGESYQSITDTISSNSLNKYVRYIIEEYGIQGISRLNGQFSGIYFDQELDNIYVFLDRIGSRPIYYYINDERFIFSSNLQAFQSLDELNLQFADGGINEFLTFGRCLGTLTPLRDIYKLPPASISKYNLNSNSLQTDIYWRPHYSPVDRPAKHFAQRISDIFENIFDEIYDLGCSQGLLLSGGSDSRLVADYIKTSSECYHMNDWIDNEANIAQNVCEVTGNEFIFLERDSNHYKRVLERSKDLANFTSWFEQGHILGYDSSRWPDLILSGLFSDTILAGYQYPKRSPSLPILNQYSNLPIGKSINTLDQYIESWLNGDYGRLEEPPNYLTPSRELTSTLPNHIVSDEGSYLNHSVKYPSLQDMVVAHGFYPITNSPTFFMYESIEQVAPTLSPYLDHRILDLALEMPIRHHLRGKVVDKSIKMRNSKLADVANPKTDIALGKHPYLHYLSSLAKKVRPPSMDASSLKPYHKANSPWTDHNELIRSNPFIGKLLESEKHLIKDLEFIEYDEVVNMYENHLEGENRGLELYALATLLAAPITREIGEVRK